MIGLGSLFIILLVGMIFLALGKLFIYVLVAFAVLWFFAFNPQLVILAIIAIVLSRLLKN